jgi:hypothetical protein
LPHELEGALHVSNEDEYLDDYLAFTFFVDSMPSVTRIAATHEIFCPKPPPFALYSLDIIAFRV